MPIYGWDMSHYDAVAGNTAERTISEGFDFVTHKAGGDANDAELGAFWSEFKGHRDELLLGAYWVLYPGSPVSRANAFCDRLDSLCPGWGDAPFILQVDCEKWGGDASTVPGKGDIRAFCDRLRERAPKLMPIVYAPEWVYGNSLTGLGYPLWASNYVTAGTDKTASGLYAKAGGDGSSRWDAYSGQTPAILQFSSSATIAGQTTCDANAYRGTRAQLTALLAPGFEDEVDKADFMAWMTEWASNTNMPGKTTNLETGDQTAIKRSLAGTLDALVRIDLQDGDHPDLGQTSKIGRDSLNQGVPDPFTGGKSPAWAVLQKIAQASIELQQAVAALTTTTGA